MVELSALSASPLTLEVHNLEMPVLTGIYSEVTQPVSRRKRFPKACIPRWSRVSQAHIARLQFLHNSLVTKIAAKSIKLAVRGTGRIDRHHAGPR